MTNEIQQLSTQRNRPTSFTVCDVPNRLNSAQTLGRTKNTGLVLSARAQKLPAQLTIFSRFIITTRYDCVYLILDSCENGVPFSPQLHRPQVNIGDVSLYEWLSSPSISEVARRGRGTACPVAVGCVCGAKSAAPEAAGGEPQEWAENEPTASSHHRKPVDCARSLRVLPRAFIRLVRGQRGRAL